MVDSFILVRWDYRAERQASSPSPGCRGAGQRRRLGRLAVLRRPRRPQGAARWPEAAAAKSQSPQPYRGGLLKAPFALGQYETRPDTYPSW